MIAAFASITTFVPQSSQEKTIMVTSITSGAAVPMSSTESANANKLCQSVVFCPVKRSLQLNWPSILFTANGRINSDFIGSTPSTLELRPGQHEITIRKRVSTLDQENEGDKRKNEYQRKSRANPLAYPNCPRVLWCKIRNQPKIYECLTLP